MTQKRRTALQQAAMEALAEFAGMYWQGSLSNAAKQTMVGLYLALYSEGVFGVADYTREFRAAKFDLANGNLFDQ
jgi:hypothetical protein